NILECYRFLKYLLPLYRILIKGSSNKVI
ncbi:hypothetical protein FPSE_06343, partial [Fusarium pseudograminearum CS3096]